MGSFKYSARDFQNSPPFKRSACFYVTISAIFERSQYLTLKQIFWKTKFFSQKLEYRFYLKVLWLKTHHFHTKLPCQKPILRQIEKWVQIGPIAKNGVTTSFFWKFGFSLRTSYKELFWCMNDPNVHIHTFTNRWILFKGDFWLWVSFSARLPYTYTCMFCLG